MQRQTYAPPAHSPPLHHPVPQHVSTVPMMRSPPPPAPQSQGSSSYGSPYQTHMPPPSNTGGGSFAPAFGGFMNDPTAQMGFQLGKTAATAGQDYIEQNVRTLCPSLLLTTIFLPLLTLSLALDKPLRLHPRPKTLLQRHNPLRPPQARSRPLPLAPQTLDARATPLLHLSSILLFPPSP